MDFLDLGDVYLSICSLFITCLAICKFFGFYSSLLTIIKHSYKSSPFQGQPISLRSFKRAIPEIFSLCSKICFTIWDCYTYAFNLWLSLSLGTSIRSYPLEASVVRDEPLVWCLFLALRDASSCEMFISRSTRYLFFPSRDPSPLHFSKWDKSFTFNLFMP